MTVERYFIEEAKKARQIEEFLKKELAMSGFSHAEVKKTPLGTRVIIHALRPGLVIGGGGANIKALTEYLTTRFKIENPHLEVEQIREPFLDPHIVAWKIASSMEKGGYFKRIANLMMEKVIEAGAKGVEVRMGGKLPSARAKTWIFVQGKPRKCGQEAIDQVRVGYAQALTKMGITGIKISILPPDVHFSDEILEKVPEPGTEAIEVKKKEVKVKKSAAEEEAEVSEDDVDSKIIEEVKQAEEEAKKEKPVKKNERKPREEKSSEAVKEEKPKRKIPAKTKSAKKPKKEPEVKAEKSEEAEKKSE
jgi:small subunit ribosomal protein S3